MLVLLAACSGPEPLDSDDTDLVVGTYDDLAHWLCHPDAPESVCDGDLDVTVVYGDGSMEPRPHVPAADPAFDCFYVYPTVSGDLTQNSDLEPGPEERFTTLIQFGRYSAVCRPFAPVYRQLTVASLLSEDDPTAGFTLAYGDVEDAWLHYLEHDNDGRPVLLVGHSQGALLLRSLLRLSIEADPAVHERIVGAHLLGMSVQVPEGELVGGDLAQTPLCTSADEWGCVTTFLTFRPEAPPGANVFVGQPLPGNEVPCTNPAALTGASTLGAVFPVSGPGGIADLLAGNTTPWDDPGAHPAVPTPFFAVPGLIDAECRQEGAFGYLEASIPDDPTDPRFDRIEGDFPLPGWGLHLVDVNLAMDDLVALAERQHAAAP
ncbi:MAG: DUF3089 domain-containing protein [Myxococcota bacterium]